VGGNNDVVSDHRTSSGAFFDVDHDPVIIEVDKKIAKWVKIPPTHFEAFYLLRYQVGEQYKSHYDWFDPVAAARYMEGILHSLKYLFSSLNEFIIDEIYN
jgi:hypothetical protein